MYILDVVHIFLSFEAFIVNAMVVLDVCSIYCYGDCRRVHMVVAFVYALTMAHLIII